MSFELLWTDKCFLVLLTLGLIITLASLRKRHIRQSFSIILHKPIAVSAGIVLLFFLTIGILDSIHFKSTKIGSKNAHSILDALLAPLGGTYEKTYSAPLSLNSFVSETQSVDGVAKQVYFPLTYPQKSIKTAQDKRIFINNVLWTALHYSLFLCFV